MQDLNDKITGGTLTASEWNEVPSEIQNVIEALGLTLSSLDLNQLGKAIAGYVANANFYTDSGTANSYVLSVIGSKQRLPEYTDGAIFEFIAGNLNTGASTVNVAGLGVKSIKLPDGTDPGAGQIQGRVTLKFDAGNDWAELQLGGRHQTTYVTASGTYNPPPGVKSLKFTAIGGGGGGGGVDGQGAGTAAAGSGGGAGGVSILTTSNIEPSYTIAIGAGSSGGTGTGGGDASDASNTTVTSTAILLTAGGGRGGEGMVATSGNDGTQGGGGGTAVGGDITSEGNDGESTRVDGGVISNFGRSGGSILGGARRGGNSAPGRDGGAYGAGGGGAGVLNATDDYDGGDGANGVVIIEEFF